MNSDSGDRNKENTEKKSGKLEGGDFKMII